jgi:hypothetical protein
MDFFHRHVARKYQMVPEQDRVVTVAPFYSGLLSKITIRAADRMFSDGDNQLVLKPGYQRIPRLHS